MKIDSTLPVLLLLSVITCTIMASTASAKLETLKSRSAAQIYGKYCISCHGRDGRAKTSKGKYNHARDIADAKWQDDVSDERIFNSIMNGRSVRGNMPAFNKKLTDDEADSLVTYVRQFRR